MNKNEKMPSYVQGGTLEGGLEVVGYTHEIQQFERFLVNVDDLEKHIEKKISENEPTAET